MMLAGEMVSPKRALGKLDRYFSDNDPAREFVVLLVDELDYMVRQPTSPPSTASPSVKCDPHYQVIPQVLRVLYTAFLVLILRVVQ